MGESHKKIFFGQNVAMKVQSSSWYDPFIYLTFFKKKPDNVWEKPSAGEGKVLKFSLEEMVMILNVLQEDSDSWSTVHTFKEEKTSIAFRWDQKDEKCLWIQVNKEYQKQLNFAQIQIFRMLLTHILQEKIEYSTTAQRKEKPQTEEAEPSDEPEREPISLIVEEEVIQGKSDQQSDKPSIKVKAIIKSQTQKALLIDFGQEKEVWIPKSTIHSEYDANKDIKQQLTIDTWILKKNDVLIEPS